MKCTRCLVLFVAATVALSASGVYGWGPQTHGRMALNALTHPTISPYLDLYGLNANTIAGLAWELDLPQWKDTFHQPAWSTICDRLWLTDPKWNTIDESRRLAFLCHIACDAGVPVSHDPALNVWTNTTIENLLEARVETWLTLPSITPYSGTYAEKMSTFYTQEINLANWAKSNLKWYNVGGEQGKYAGWTGVTYGQNLCQAMLLEYFVTKPAGFGMAMPSPVPEPTMLSLLIVSGLSLLYWRHRKR